MTVRLAKDSIDLAIVTTNTEAMTSFYRDVLGFRYLGETATRATPGGSVRRLLCGSSQIKLVSYATAPSSRAAGGAVADATGFRYWTISVTNLDEIVLACERAGHPIVVPVKEVSPGVRVAIAEDPDGNLVEFLSSS
jgi:catechol 2,3-dioxygenase-like lactoylglutathione lyase family enzyme